jgi:hypothetical protein
MSRSRSLTAGTARATEAGPTRGTAAGKDERRGARIAGAALVASPVLWFGGVLPFRSSAIFGFYEHYETDPIRALNALTGQQAAWITQTVLFFAGTAVAVVGLALLARLLWRTRAAALARAGVLGVVAMAALYGWGFVLRLTAPTDGVRTEDEIPALLIPAHTGWLNTVTVGLTALTLIVYGAALFRTRRARLAGALVVALSALVLVALLGRGSLPPALVFPIAAILGVRLLFWGAGRPRTGG